MKLTASRATAKAAEKGVRKALRDGQAKAAPTKVPARRWMWGPFAISGADYIAGLAAGRAHNPKYALIVIGLPLLLAGVLGVCHLIGKPLRGLDRPAEVGYVVSCLSALAGWSAAASYDWWALAVGVVCAAWLASCTWMAARPGGLPTWAGALVGTGVAVSALVVLNPLTMPLRWALAWVLGTVPVAVPWWMHRRVRRGVNIDSGLGGTADRARRAAEVNRTWQKIIEAAQATFEGLALVSVRATANLSIAKVRLPGGTTVDELQAGLARLESAADLRTGSLACEPDPGGMAQQAVLTHTERDPHASVQEWPGRTVDTITKPLAGGVRADGTIAEVAICTPEGGRNALAGGTRGAGKSTWMNALIAEAMPCEDEVSVGIDGKGGGIELGPWFEFGAMPVVATDVASARALLVALLAITQGRGVLLKQRGRRTWVVGPEFDEKKGVDGPHITVWVDEAAQVQGLDWVCGVLSLTLGQLSRFAQVSQVIATQFPKAQSLGDAGLRGQMDIRVAFRHGTDNEASFTLEGYSNFGERLPAGNWFKRRPGTYLLVDGDDRDSVPVRSYRAPDEVITHVAKWRAESPVLVDEESYRAALDALPTILAERVDSLGEDELAELETAVHQTLRKLTYPAARPTRQVATEPASTPTPPPASQPVAAEVAPATSAELAEDLAGLVPPPGVAHEEWLATMAALERRLAALPEGHLDSMKVAPRPGMPDTAPANFQRARSDLEGVMATIREKLARPEGATRKELMEATGKGRSFVQDRLAALRDAGEAVQDPSEFGRWRLVVESAVTDRD
jgi:hypothetical protein